MTLFNTNLQKLGWGNKECFTTVMSINQRLRQEETGNIKYNHLVITNNMNTNAQQLRMLSGNINGEVCNTKVSDEETPLP